MLIWREWINNLTTEGTGFAFLDKLLQVDRLIDLGLVFSDAETLSSMLATALAYMSLSCRTRIHIFIREEESVGVQKRCGLTVEDGDAGWVVYACPPSHADRKGADYDGG